MKLFILFLIHLFICTNCEIATFDSVNKINNLDFYTHRGTYNNADVINLYINNSLEEDVQIGFRCGTYLEMFYQYCENETWSDTLLFDYMYLKCPTLSETVPKEYIYKYSTSPAIFDTAGVYRLILRYYKIESNSSDFITSNTFKILK